MLNQREYTNAQTLPFPVWEAMFISCHVVQFDKMCLREPIEKGNLLFYFYLFIYF